MSKLFCSSPQLCVLERQMQQPPGYRPRGGGIWIMNEAEWRNRGNYLEIVDCVVSRMQMEHLKRRIEEIFCEAGQKLIFRYSRIRSALLGSARPKTAASFAAAHMASYLEMAYFSPKRAVVRIVSTSSSFGAASMSVARG